MKTLIQKFNQPDTLAMITLYPKKGETYSEGTTGVASYAKNLVTRLSRNVVVLCDYALQPNIYREQNTFVMRVFKNGHWHMWLEIFKALRNILAVKKVLLQLDFAMYGGFFNIGLSLPFLALLKLFGYESSVIMHHVVVDIAKLSGHVGLGRGSSDKLKIYLYNAAFAVFYTLLGLTTKSIIVLEEGLKQRLHRYINPHKVVVLPHAVDASLTAPNRLRARKKLGVKSDELMVLFFGFVNWFKGADFFVNSFAGKRTLNGKKVKFILAGGESATQKNRKAYQRYFQQVSASISHAKNIHLTGYVPQRQIGRYFSAADLVVFPYRDFMCASGVLSLTFSYGKPFVASTAFAKMFEGNDFKNSLKAVGLDNEEIVFPLKRKACVATVEKVLANGAKAKLVSLAELMRERRSFSNTANQLDDILFAPSSVVQKSLAFGYTK